MEAFVAPSSRFEKSSQTMHRLVLLCKDEEGYRNLMKLSSIGYLEGFYYKPRIDKEVLKQYSKGLVAIVGGLNSEPVYYLQVEQVEEAKRVVQEYVDIFGTKDFYLGVQHHGIPFQKKINGYYQQIAKDLKLKLVATNDVHYLHRKDAENHDVLLCIQQATNLEDQRRPRLPSDDYYLKSMDEMVQALGEIPDCIKNTVEIVEKCNVELEFNKLHLPRFEPPRGLTKEDYLQKLCEEGLKNQLAEVTPEYKERLKFELSVINQMAYTSYFLIVWDFIHYAKSHHIPVGPGRGSAAGSLVSYALGITTVNPLRHELLFERFLNPDRVSMPDIDIDFCYERRDEVIHYVTQKYGQDNVAQIITFGTMMARAVIRDVGRAMGMPYGDVDRIAKLIPMELNITLEHALKQEPRLEEAIASDNRIKKLIESAKALEGITRHASTHAAGVVISDQPLTEYSPLFKEKDAVTTQYDMKALEAIGVLKMDFLGLRTLTVVDETIKLLKKTRGLTIDINKIPLDDVKTYELLSAGETFGVFQLESSGMRDILRKMKPKVFEDIAALLALYRPGPIGSGMIDDFIRRKQNPGLSNYDHPALEPILKETYGIILYQEQVMKIVNILAGFSLAQADNLRRAMGKKIPEVMEKEKQHFITGAAKNNVTPKVAEKIFNLIEYFAGYGFNKSHSVAYSYISYQTAYLKANYTIEFITALLTSERDNTDKVVRYIDEAKRCGIKVLGPDVNESSFEFTCHKDNIRFGLSAIKNVGSTAIESILMSRKEKGKFTSYYDFAERVDLRLVNRKVLESLIKVGAFDSMGYKRSPLMAVLDQALEMGDRAQKEKKSGQMSLFSPAGQDNGQKAFRDVPEMEEWIDTQLLAYEKELLGFYLTSHPLTKFESVIKTYATDTSISLSEKADQSEVMVGGIINSLKRINTKKGEPMAFVTLQDLNGTCEVVVFPETLRKYQDLIQADRTVFVRGKISSKDEEAKIIANDVMAMETARQKLTKVFSLDLKTAGLTVEVLQKLKLVLESNKGETPVTINFLDQKGECFQLIPSGEYRVGATENLWRELCDLLGKESVRVRS
jgi:DNA polymerase-3 subunit alpha